MPTQPTSPTLVPAIASTTQSLSPLEQEVLDEYAKLLDNLNHLAKDIGELSEKPVNEIIDGLRTLERKTGLVFTLLKASVYSIVLQQQLDVETREAEDVRQDGEGRESGGEDGYA